MPKAVPGKWPGIVLRSYSQILFVDNLWTGCGVLIALSFLSASSILFSCLGLIISSLAAILLMQDRRLVEGGLYGFNGALLGLFWSWYFLVSFYSLFFFVLIASFIAPLQILLTRLLTRGKYNLPVTSLPSVILFLSGLFAVYGVTVRMGLIPPSRMYLPPNGGAGPLIDILPRSESGLFSFLKAHNLHIWFALLLSLFIHSRISFLASIVGITSGILIVLLPPLKDLPAPQVFVGFNAFPLALALFGIFLAPTGRALGFTCLALPLCTLSWYGLARIFTPLLLPVLTLPYNLTLFLCLFLVRAMGLDRFGLFAWPFHPITTPKDSHPPPFDGSDMFLSMIASAGRITILSGAGTSTESGIPDIRGKSAFWERFSPEILVLQNFLDREDARKRYWVMEGMFYRLVTEAVPNRVHKAARWLEDSKKLECVITQNVDGLFQRAGVTPAKVIEIHGSASRIRCMGCGTVYGRKEIEPVMDEGLPSPRCRICGGILRPDTVFMGEEVNRILLGEAIFRVCASDLLVIIGTTLIVEPVASIPRIASEKGIPLTIINHTPTPMDSQARLVIRESAGAFLEKIMEKGVPYAGGITHPAAKDSPRTRHDTIRVVQ